MQPTSYTIIISEEQRKCIVEALAKFPPNVTEEEADADIEAFGLLILKDMFEELPEAEKENPKIHHGFCI